MKLSIKPGIVGMGLTTVTSRTPNNWCKIGRNSWCSC